MLNSIPTEFLAITTKIIRFPEIKNQIISIFNFYFNQKTELITLLYTAALHPLIKRLYVFQVILHVKNTFHFFFCHLFHNPAVF